MWLRLVRVFCGLFVGAVVLFVCILRFYADLCLEGIDMLRPQVTVQYDSKEYREYVRYAEKEYEDRKMIKAYLADPLVARIAQDFASRNHIPNKKESMKKLSVYKIPYPIYSMCSLFLTVVLTFGGVFFMVWFFILV